MKPKLEYQLVCASFGTRGHSTHAHIMPTRAKTPKQREQRLIDINHHYEMLVDRGRTPTSIRFNSSELPWRIQVREVGKWGFEK